MKSENKAQLHIDELCYYIMIFLFMCIRAVGLQDGQWPFKVLLIMGLVAFVPKFLLTKFNGIDQILSLILIALGVGIYFVNGHLEFLVGVCMVVGIKNVPIDRAVKVALGIWGTLFVFSVIRALFGGFQGYVSLQQKAGLGFSLIRYSLGFSHQNVLHMTYLIIVLMILYVTKLKGKRLILQSILLFLGNIYIFAYSVSYTGFISVSFALAINLYFAFRKNINLVEKILVTVFLVVCLSVLTIGPFLLSDKLFSVVDILTNYRFMMAKNVFGVYPPNFFGHSEDIHALSYNLDSSYAYLLYYSGIIAFGFFGLSYLLTSLNLMKRRNQQGVALMMGVGISGITEQYVGNLSFKNISLFFIGDYVFNFLSERIVSKINVLNFHNSVINLRRDAVSWEAFSKFAGEIRGFFRRTPWIKCVLTGVITALAGLLLFGIFHKEPTKLYCVAKYEFEGNTFIYHEEEKSRLDDGLLIGNPKEGDLILEPSYVNLKIETYRGMISSAVWGFIAGFVVSALAFGFKRLKNGGDSLGEYGTRLKELLFFEPTGWEETEENSKPRLLIYAHYYYPDVASTGQILTELAEGLKDFFKVTVVCTVPSYTGQTTDYYKKHKYYYEIINGVYTLRIRVPRFRKNFSVSRIVNITSYFLSALIATMKVGKQDYVFTISQPPVLGGMLGRIGSRLKKAKFIYNIQDFNPEQIEAVKYSGNKPVLNTMMSLDKASCHKADKIIIVGRDMEDTLKKRFGENLVYKGKKIDFTHINNWIDEKTIVPLPKDNQKVTEFKEKYGLTGKTVVMYSGNLGLYYDLLNIVKVLEKHKDNKSVVFAFVGEGSVKEEIQNYVDEHQLNNVVFIPYQDKEDLVYSLNAADIHLVVNALGIKGVSVPSKLYGVMAAGKPVLGILEEGSEARLIIEDAGCGEVVSPGDYEAIDGLISSFLGGECDLDSMGENGRIYLEQNLSRDISIQKYKDEILSI